MNSTLEAAAGLLLAPAPTLPDLCRLYRWMRSARCVDEAEARLVARGEAFFQVSGSGHEASAALAPALRAGDYLHLHYRDKALLLARGLPLREFFDSLLCRSSSHSAGRQMSAHFSAPALNVLSIVGPVGNQALQAVGVAQQIGGRPDCPVVVCSMGDGTTQQGEVLEAIAEAVRSTLPVLFLVHDNGLAISTATRGQTFYSRPDREAARFYGLPIERIDGRDAMLCQARLQTLVAAIRRERRPALCLMSVDRLCSHTHGDDDSAYRDPAALAEARRWGDPLPRLRLALCRAGMMPGDIDELDVRIAAEVDAAAQAALDATPSAGASSTVPPVPVAEALEEYRGDAGPATLTMTAALREALREWLGTDPRVSLYGQDIEDPKGDVFGVTRGLSSQFPGRVRNAPLSESTIVGTSIGRALAGGRPVAFVQFADFLPLAFNQIFSELGAMHWRSNGGWQAPVVLLAPCGGYRPGLGPFHSHTLESVLAHVPGLDVAMPSSAADAAGMLNAALRGPHPTVLLYPKALLNDLQRGTSDDVARHHVVRGRARRVRCGDALTLVAWGNTVPLCERVAERLALAGVQVDLLDLRWIAPWDRAAVVASAERSRRLLVVHEDNHTAGFGAEVLASVAEALPAGLRCRRVTRADSLLPCHPADQLALLPSFERILEAAAALLEMPLEWAPAPTGALGHHVVPVMGSSPSDLNVEVAAVCVEIGTAVDVGQLLACVEADKAVVEIHAPVAGVVVELHVRPGQKASVGSPLLTLSSRARLACRSAAAAGAMAYPVADRAVRIGPAPLLGGAPTSAEAFASSGLEKTAVQVQLTGLGVARGHGRLRNDELLRRLPSLADPHGTVPGHDGIFARTGIQTRVVAGPGQDVVGMAEEAARAALRMAGVQAHELGLVICSTSTPAMLSPSTACLLLQRLAPGAEVAAYDLSAACSGYLYALAQAWDFLQQQPLSRVLVVTSELMRSIVDADDPATSPLFGDAATATVLGTSVGSGRSLAKLQRPLLGAVGDDGRSLCVPLPGGDAKLRMDGRVVFGEAVRRMGSVLERACADAGLKADELTLVVPHQANGRILEALRHRLRLQPEQVWNEIRDQGNTSSSSIPLALHTVLRRDTGGSRMGLCAFGAGWTFGAALLTTD